MVHTYMKKIRCDFFLMSILVLNYENIEKRVLFFKLDFDLNMTF